MFQFVFHILRIPIPRFAMGGLGLRAVPPRTPGGIRRPTRTLDPVTAAERWVRELEDETGAVSITKAAAVGAEEQNGATSSARSTAVETSSAAKPDYRPRNESSEGAGRVLPDFYIGSYENALKLARDDARVLCVILVSEENDDVPEFKRSVNQLSTSPHPLMHRVPDPYLQTRTLFVSWLTMILLYGEVTSEIQAHIKVSMECISSGQSANNQHWDHSCSQTQCHGISIRRLPFFTSPAWPSWSSCHFFTTSSTHRTGSL